MKQFLSRRKDNQHPKTELESEEDDKKAHMMKLDTFNTELNLTATSSRRAATIMQKIQKGIHPTIIIWEI